MKAEVGELKDVCKEIEDVDVDWEVLGDSDCAGGKTGDSFGGGFAGQGERTVSLGRLLVANEALEIKKRWLEMRKSAGL